MFENFNPENDFDIKSVEKDPEQLKNIYEEQNNSIELEEDDWLNNLSKEQLENAKSLIEDIEEQEKNENFLENLSDDNTIHL